MSRRPRYWWTTVKGGRRSLRHPYKYLLDRGEIIARRRKRRSGDSA